MRVIGICLVVATLAGCGADGQPVRPKGGVGVSIGSGGVSVGGNVGVRSGPVTVSVGL